MKRLVAKVLKSFSYGEKGFTLIELLVVIAILGILAAVAIPSVAQFVGRGQSQADLSELANVQAAMDAMMADKAITTVALTAATADMSIFPTGNALYPDYMRTKTTSRTYKCDATGLVEPG